MEQIIQDKKIVFASNRYPGVTVNDITEPERTLILKMILIAAEDYYEDPEYRRTARNRCLYHKPQLQPHDYLRLRERIEGGGFQSISPRYGIEILRGSRLRLFERAAHQQMLLRRCRP